MKNAKKNVTPGTPVKELVGKTPVKELGTPVKELETPKSMQDISKTVDLSNLSPMDLLNYVRKNKKTNSSKTTTKEEKTITPYDKRISKLEIFRKDFFKIMGLDEKTWTDLVSFANKMIKDVQKINGTHDDGKDPFYGSPAVALNNSIHLIGTLSYKLYDFRQEIKSFDRAALNEFEKGFAVFLLHEMNCNSEFCNSRTESELHYNRL